ncbi:MAG: Gfo/Idh/MocA family oxidoreductase [Planctomycetes bacterium]|nr:Gfo/Idh/MocA family oxidoreductase [Planctomycetota bacterium]
MKRAENARVNYAIVGCGAMAMGHAAAAASDPRSAVRYFVDVDVSRAQALAQKHGGTAASDYRRALADPEVHAVALVLPHHLHCDYAVRAAEAGKHVFVEKPMAVNVAECDQMIQAAAGAGIVLFVGHVLRFYEANVRIKALIESGELGTPFFARYHSAQRPDFTPTRMHLADPKLGGGVILAGEVHHTDLMRWWLGEVERVRGYHLSVRPIYREMDSPEFSMVTYEFVSGAVGESSYSYATYVAGLRPQFKATVQFERGTVQVLSDGQMTIVRDASPNKPETVMTDASKAVSKEIPHMTSAILDGTPLACTPQDARRAVELCQAAERSAHLARDVEV